MRIVIRSLLPIFLHLHSLVQATRHRELPTRSSLRWLEKERSVLVRLEIPDLPLWNEDEQIGEKLPSALIFNFTLSHDNRTLILNDVPILPVQNPYVPPRLYAYQTSETLAQFDNETLTDYNDCPLFSLDYARVVTQVTFEATRILDLDILGAGIAEYNALLPSNEQRLIHLFLDHIEPKSASISSMTFKIADVHLEDRNSSYQFPAPESLKTCTMWSWLCADTQFYPWYLYIYRQNFDDYGKIGSMRHLVHTRWANLLERNGAVQIGVIGFVICIVLLSLLGYGIYRMWKRTQELWQRRVGDVDAWTADEEIGGLLDDEEEEDDDDDDTYVRKDEVEMEDWTGAAEPESKPLPLPPAPPPVPPKGEPSRS